jgi:hypothetical protein
MKNTDITVTMIHTPGGTAHHQAKRMAPDRKAW